jgi:hypothetical protein
MDRLNLSVCSKRGPGSYLKIKTAALATPYNSKWGPEQHMIKRNLYGGQEGYACKFRNHIGCRRDIITCSKICKQLRPNVSE